MSKMETDEAPVVLPSTSTSALQISLHPLPILNISEHLTRMKLIKNTNSPLVLGALLGTQNGREVEIVNTFQLALDEDVEDKVDHGFLVARKEQYKQVFPSLDLIGWYTVTQQPTSRHIALHEQFIAYTPNPILVILQPFGASSKADASGQTLPLKAYEPTVEIRERRSRNVFVEAAFSIETGEAERIAVDWSAKGGEGGTSLESHIQTQRAAVKMLHDRIKILTQYVANVVSGSSQKDHTALRSIAALLASLPASEHPSFREEFDKEYEDVHLTAYLSSLTKVASAMNDIVDKHALVSAASGREEMGGRFGPSMRRPRMGRGMGPMGSDWH